MIGFGQSQEEMLNGSQDSLIIEKYPNVNRTKTSEIIDGQVLTQTVYPVIFVHGLNGDFSAWQGFIDFISPTWLFGGYLDFCLNSYGSSNQDICNSDYEITNLTSGLTNADYYVIDFDCNINVCGTTNSWSNSRLSNQASVIVQARALGLAINDVLNVTQSEKVILVCHSMGGLAAREYIQNSDHWVNSSHHRVAKLVTSGTPHSGSNYTWGTGGGAGYDEKSEAVRDLRTSYFYSQEDGAYLFGNGIYEHTDDIRNSLFWNYYNVDVDCDGQPGEYISSGLNDRSLPNNVDYACIIGSQDLIVSSSSSNLSNIYNSDKIEIFTCDQCSHSVISASNYHLTQNADEPVYQTFKALDEPDWFHLAYKVDLNQYYKGYLTYQDVDHPLGDYSVDYDDYYFVLNNPSSVNISVSNLPPGSFADILDPNYNILSSGFVNGSGDINISTGNLSSGYYFLEIRGNAYAHPTFGSPPWNYPYQFLIYDNTTTLENHLPINRSLIKITDLLGRETKGSKNQPLFYIYDDGTVEKRITID